MHLDSDFWVDEHKSKAREIKRRAIRMISYQNHSHLNSNSASDSHLFKSRLKKAPKKGH